MKNEEISSWNDLTLYLNSKELTADSLIEILSTKVLDKENFNKYVVHVKGPSYNSTINANYATAIVDFQKSFDSFLGKLQKKGHREKFLINFKVEKGSSTYLSDNIQAILEKVITEAFPKMTSTQIFYLCVILIGTIAGCYLIPSCIKKFLEFYEKKAEQNKDRGILDIANKLIELLSDKKVKKVIDEAEKCGENCKNAFLLNTPVNTIDSVDINGKDYPKAEVIQYQKPQIETPTTSYVITDLFEICTLKINDPNSFKMTVKFSNNKKPNNSFDLIGSSKDKENNSYLDSDEMELICNAISKYKKKIKLMANIEFNKEVPVGGTILQILNTEQEK